MKSYYNLKDFITSSYLVQISFTDVPQTYTKLHMKVVLALRHHTKTEIALKFSFIGTNLFKDLKKH